MPRHKRRGKRLTRPTFDTSIVPEDQKYQATGVGRFWNTTDRQQIPTYHQGTLLQLLEDQGGIMKFQTFHGDYRQVLTTRREGSVSQGWPPLGTLPATRPRTGAASALGAAPSDSAVRVVLPNAGVYAIIQNELHKNVGMGFRQSKDKKMGYGKTTTHTAMQVIEYVHANYNDAHWKITECADGRDRLHLFNIGEKKKVALVAAPANNPYTAPPNLTDLGGGTRTRRRHRRRSRSGRRRRRKTRKN